MKLFPHHSSEADLVHDTICVPFASSAGLTVAALLECVSQRYAAWHPFVVHEFQLRPEHATAVSSPDTPAAALLPAAASASSASATSAQLTVIVEESARSVQTRAELKAAEARRIAEREEAERAAEQRQREQRAAIERAGTVHWSLVNACPEARVSLDDHALVVENSGSLDQWVPVLVAPPAYSGQHFVSFLIEKLPPSTNAWSMCVGWVPTTFKLAHQQRWVGAQGSYGLIAGTGGRCAASGQSVPYGVQFGEGDVVSTLLDLDAGTIEFFVNERPQGVAFKEATGPLHAAVSMTATGARVRLLADDAPPRKHAAAVAAHRAAAAVANARRVQLLSAEFGGAQAEVLAVACAAEAELLRLETERRQLTRANRAPPRSSSASSALDGMKDGGGGGASVHDDDEVDPESREQALSIVTNEAFTAAAESSALSDDDEPEHLSPSPASPRRSESVSSVLSASNPALAVLCRDATVTDWWDPTFSARRDDAVQYTDPGRRLLRLVHRGSHDKWRCARGLRVYREGTHFFEVYIEALGATSNSWNMCVGVVPLDFDPAHEKIWVGAQKSWSYIGGNGHRVYDGANAVPYGEPFGKGDTIGVLLDFDRRSIEFFKNGRSQGVAFSAELSAPVCAAVSFTAARTCLRLRGTPMTWVRPRLQQALRAQRALAELAERVGNVWDRDRSVQLGHAAGGDSPLSAIEWRALAALSASSHDGGSSAAAAASDAVTAAAVAAACEPDDATPLAFDADARTVLNRGTTNAWQTCMSLLHYDSGRRYVELIIEAVGESTNTWFMCLGVVPSTFSLANEKQRWVGAQGGWGFIAATGGKCRNVGKSEKYGRRFGPGDRVGVLMDFDNKQLEFFVNRVSQGVAFADLSGSVHVAVSMAGRGARVRIDALCEREAPLIAGMALYR
jgi:hypothetical protein